ncbi:hypothetical protein D1007_22141 [Hordeum vulgare]|nr:hypothetical protein D1007_22141 [Hordeum vulgare]
MSPPSSPKTPMRLPASDMTTLSCRAAITRLRPLPPPRRDVMTLNRNDMDDISKECHDITRRYILKRRMLARYSDGDVFSSGIGTNITDDFGAEVGTSADDGFRCDDDLDDAE